jgi:hypothetical protein
MTAAAALIAAAATPIRLDPRNPHYFEFRGKTIALITSGEHYGAVIDGLFDYRRYLDTLAKDGLNFTRLFGGSYIEIPGQSFGIRRNDLAPEPGHFVAPWARSGDKLDLDKWNPEFFQRYREFLGEAGKRGIVVELTFFSSQYQEAQWKVSPFYPANNVNGTNAIDWHEVNTLHNGNILAWQERYVRKLVHEAADFDNVIFEIQNEPWSDRGKLASVVNPYLQGPARDRYPNSIDVADELSTAWQARVAEWIASEDGANRHLVAQNYSNFGFPVRELAPGVSIVNFHYAYPMAAEWNYGLGKAIGYDETGFMGRDDLTYCRQAWNFMMSGGSTFDALDYSFSVGHEDGSDPGPNGPGGGSAELRRELGVLHTFLSSLSLQALAPDHQTVTHAGGVYARALSTPGGVYDLYFDGDGPAKITLELPAGQYSGGWTDIVNGNITPLPAFRHGGGEKIMETPSFHGGIALELKLAGN